ncbi:hypothetical protein [Lysobacter sp. N42]|uniref:hypothetical protein n=1 Tax=Lysobacter sp. N42 TaxID=2545719 RepID=UPI0010439B3C|nr:hypothetical protein [Lysobacter sp. N42]TCZ78543.1 hypothetical protein EYQ95_25620 [Lysobacter sp. N42]
MFSTIASWVDRKSVRALLAAVAVLATVMLGPFAFILVAVGPREPLLFLLGLGGIAGLLGGGARIWLGARFFALPAWARIALALLITAGTCAAFLAALALPGKIYWATAAPLVGVAGLALLAGSVTGPGPGPNNSSKPTPLRGAA